MNPRYKMIIKVWSLALVISLCTGLATTLTSSSEIAFLARLMGSIFFFGMYIVVSKAVKKNDQMIKASNGFKQNLFDPYILKLTLKLCIIGWTVFAVLEYLSLNKISWITVFMLGVIIFPFTMGLIPLKLRDNKFRGR